MKYFTEKYGNTLDFKGTCMPAREREMELRRDLNRIVTAACRHRLYKAQIKGFDNMVIDTKTNTWTLDVIATAGYHRRFRKLLRNPAPTLRRWAKEDARKNKRDARRLARIAHKGEKADAEGT